MSVTSQSDEHKRQVNLQLRLSFELKAAARDERETLSRLRFTWAARIAKELKQPLGDVAGAVVDKAVAAPITTRKGQLDEGAPCFLGTALRMFACAPAASAIASLLRWHPKNSNGNFSMDAGKQMSGTTSTQWILFDCSSVSAVLGIAM